MLSKHLFNGTNWWIDPYWNSGTNAVCNKDIVLAMTNKEGGTHVDDSGSAKYAAAKSQGRIAVGKWQVSDVVRLGSLVSIAGDELLEYLQEHFPESAEQGGANLAVVFAACRPPWPLIGQPGVLSSSNRTTLPRSSRNGFGRFVLSRLIW
jgi:hypothetical protein